MMASHRSEGPTKEVLFSVDQGECFHTVNLPEAILVDNIQTAPGNQNHIFLVHGIACLKTDAHPDCSFTGGSAPVGKLFAVDIQELIGSDWKECNSSENSSDYEAWDIPHEGSCLLGAKRRLRRKARDAFCFHPIGYRSEVQILEPCQCSLEDIECEFGYIRDANNTCAPIASLDANEACPVSLDGMMASLNLMQFYITYTLVNEMKTTTTTKTILIFSLVHDNVIQNIFRGL